VNAASAAVWALAIGLTAYWVGPPIADVAADEGLLAWVVVAALIAGFAIVLARKHLRQKG
jgi:membrane protein DedA with SNARE-associated domain